jgi:hypothetical protein
MAKAAATIIESDWLTAASQSLRFRLTARKILDNRTPTDTYENQPFGEPLEFCTKWVDRRHECDQIQCVT